jgi:N-acetylglucosamine-6-sulfatase
MPTPHQERYLAQEVVTFLEEATEPFFAWVCPNSPHWPMEPSKANASKWEDVYWTNRPEWASWVDEDVSAKPSWIQALDAPSPIDLSATNGTERQRLQELADVDDTIGEVWTYLVETGLIDDTVVIISSDNGNHMFEHRVVQLSKNTPYDISAKVPLVLAGAGIDEGSTLDMPVYAAQDVTATAVDIAGADPGTPVDGISLLAIADDPESFTGRGLLGHRSNAEDTVAGMPAADWIVVDQGSGLRKLIRYQGASGSDQFEAYDLDRDPDEVSNWANDADRLAERDQLESALDGLLA